MDLARRWMSKVFEATGGDPVLTPKMRTIWREALAEPAVAAESAVSVAIIEFVSQAYGAAIEAGVMPKPVDAA